MSVPVSAVHELANLAVAATDAAEHVLDVAERTMDEQASIALVERANEIMELSKRLYILVDQLTSSNGDETIGFLRRVPTDVQRAFTLIGKDVS